jgi:hypothetical protein
VHDIRVGSTDGRGTQADALEEAGSEAGHHDVGAGGQRAGDVPVRGIPEVEHDAGLAPIPGTAGPVLLRRRSRPGDLHDLGPVVGEEHRGHGTGHPGGEVEDADARQRTRHEVLSPPVIDGAAGASSSLLR